MQKFGVHVSISGGVDKAPERAEANGCDTFQLFVSNPRSWSPPAITPQQADNFRELITAKAQSPVTVHATYLPNLANPEKAAHLKATEHILLQYQAAKDIGASYLVLHPGSHKKSGTDNGIAQICSALCRITDEIPDGPQWLLENTAGGGNTIGRSAAELAAIYRRSGLGSDKIGICFDTCHAFASGIDIRKNNVFAAFCRDIEKEMYHGAVKVIHLNDSMFGFAGGKDRHQHIGLGNIGEEGMRQILRSKYTKDLPVILETPINDERDDQGNLQAARLLAGTGK